jgi:hypothetical protein
MSLATAGAGMGGMAGAGAAGAGMTMAHANAIARPAAPNLPPGTNAPPGGMAPPSSAAAALAADIVDKTQISLKQVRDLSHMPLVAIDLYAKEPHVAMFPPKPEDPAENVNPQIVGKMKSFVALEPTEAAHKTLRKWLSKSKGYADLQTDALAKSDNKNAIVIESPHQWLGVRRLADVPAFVKSKVEQDESTTPAIAEEVSQGVGVVMANSTLDGSVPQGDDFDRVVCKVRLTESKKAVTILPEEAVQLLLNNAQSHVARKVKAEDEEEIVDYPCCLAVPAVYCNDKSVEALLDAAGGTGVVFQRSVCALAGSLLPGVEGQPNPVIAHLNKVLQAMHKEFVKEQVTNPDARFEEDMILLLTGMTNDTADCTAIQISGPQEDNLSCLYGNFKVICNVSYQHEKPDSILDKVVSEVFDNIDILAPEADNPIAMIAYGSLEDQKSIEVKFEKLKKSLEDWEDLPLFKTKTDCVAMGTSVLGAVSHGRLSKIVQISGKKPKKALAIDIQNVAPGAVGVRMNYHGGAEKKWLPVKTIFDFDRRVPAGPSPIDLNAAECAVYRNDPAAPKLSADDLFKAISGNEGSAGIPKREEAALNLRLQIVQKLTRDGEWMNIGDVMSPLVETDKDGNKIACEKLALDLSLGATGLISNSLTGER